MDLSKRCLLAPNAFKGSLSSTQAARAMATGVRRSGGTATLLPLADGGDGTLEVLRKPLGLVVRRTKALDPLGRPIPVRWGYNPKTRWAVVEMAQASGLALLKRGERHPMETTSFGTGQVIRAAIQAGAKVVLLGLGGSATVDGGLGILQALGARVIIFKSGVRQTLDRPAAGKDLLLLHEINRDSPVGTGLLSVGCGTAFSSPPGRKCPVKRNFQVTGDSLVKTLKGVRLRILCDVANPLTGARGAARAFGPQKGATPSEVFHLERGLKRLAALARSEGKDISKIPGTGAAGGAAAGLLGFTHARLERGTETISRLIGLEKKVKQADLVLTGEGRVDRTSWEGKALGGVAQICRRHNTPLIAITGEIGPGGRRRGVRVVLLGNKKMSASEKMRKAKKLIQTTVQAVLRFA